MIEIALPKDWYSKRLKHLATYNDEVLAESTDEDKDIDYIEISGVSLSHGIEEIERTSFGQAPSRARRKVRSGDILISTVRTYLRSIAKVDEASPDLIASTGFCVVRPNDDVDSGFLGWAAKSEPFVSEVVARSVGVSYPAINASELVTIYMPLPPLYTQRRIARFLDEKVARIDGLIAKKRELLDRLAEKRQALITRAVTKGLNPNAPMKSSGIDLLGDIPAHWEVRRIKELGKLIGGAGFPHEFQGQRDLELPFFKVIDLGRVTQSQKMLKAENSVDRTTAKMLGASVIERGNVAFAKVGAALLLNRFRSIGVPCCIDNNMMAFRPGRYVSPDFALLAFSIIDFSNIVNPGAVPSVSGSQVGQIEIALPHFEQQIKIVKSLGQKFEKIESAEEQITSSLGLIGQYRGALITSAVTGQLTELR